jgi:hypothetical protein
MRLDHVSYVTSHDQLADTVQRLGSRLGSTFVDGGVHPRFGTRNFTLALQNGHYIEVVCPLDHPATNGKAIAKIVKVEIARDEKRITDWLGNDLATALGSEVEVMWLSSTDTEGESEVVAVRLMTPSGVVRVD